jgi:hypothetical protein
MFWTHWNLLALRSFYGLAASGSETEYSTYVSQIGAGIGSSFYCWKCVNCHVGMYVYKAAHLKLIIQPTTMLETFIITLHRSN